MLSNVMGVKDRTSLVILLSVAALASHALTALAQSPDSVRAGRASGAVAVPNWARDARWYHIYVPRFHNGERSNDPKGTVPWNSEWPPRSKSAGGGEPNASHGLDSISFGGDLQGVAARLPYLKGLGINTLRLSPIFHGNTTPHSGAIDFRHIDPSISAKIPSSAAGKERLDPNSWVWLPGDRVFLDLVSRAHKLGFRVLVDAAFSPLAKNFWALEELRRDGKDSPLADWFDKGPRGVMPSVESASASREPLFAFRHAADVLAAGAQKHLFEITTRWMDPNGDGNPADGIDGWWLPAANKLPLGFLKKWRAHVKKINPKAIVVGDGHRKAMQWLATGACDLTVNHKAPESLRRFFRLGQKNYSVEQLLDDLAMAYERQPSALRHAMPLGLTNPVLGRALDQLVPFKGTSGKPGSDAVVSSAEVAMRWRLATAVQHCLPGAPMTDYGDEVGLLGMGEASRGPMLWSDLANTGKSPGVATEKKDFASLIQWLHLRRDLDPPLRAGGFRVVMSDAKRKLFAFSRPLADEEVIVLVNYGNTKQRVVVETSKPGQLVAILIPHLGPTQRRMPFGKKKNTSDSPLIKPLVANGSRQFANDRGEVKLWIGPNSIRLILAYDNEAP